MDVRGTFGIMNALSNATSSSLAIWWIDPLNDICPGQRNLLHFTGI